MQRGKDSSNVSLSRVRQPTDLKKAAMEDYVQNIVFKDVLI